jgi:hypothetical protein
LPALGYRLIVGATVKLSLQQIERGVPPAK